MLFFSRYVCSGNNECTKQEIPVGTPYLEGFPPAEEIPTLSWITDLVGALLRINVGTIRLVSGDFCCCFVL